MSMFERYTDEAKRAIFFAHFEAVHRDESAIGVGDLLIGLTREIPTRASRIAPLKQNAVQLRSAAGIPHLPSSSFEYLRKKEIPLDRDAKTAVAYASREADWDGYYWIDSDHLLRALLRSPNAISSAMHAHGLELKTLRKASKKDRSEFPEKKGHSFFKIKAKLKRIKKYAVIASLIVLVAIFIYLKSQGQFIF